MSSSKIVSGKRDKQKLEGIPPPSLIIVFQNWKNWLPSILHKKTFVPLLIATLQFRLLPFFRGVEQFPLEEKACSYVRSNVWLCLYICVCLCVFAVMVNQESVKSNPEKFLHKNLLQNFSHCRPNFELKLAYYQEYYMVQLNIL